MRPIWFAAGAAAGVYATTKARRAAEALTVDGIHDHSHLAPSTDIELAPFLRDGHERNAQALDLREDRVLGRAVDHVGRVAALAAAGFHPSLGRGGVAVDGVARGARRAAAEGKPIVAVRKGHAAAYPRPRCL